MSRVCLSYHQWPDDIDPSFFHPLRSPYVERFYAPVLGPGCVTVLRRLDLLLACGIDECADAEELGLERDPEYRKWLDENPWSTP